MSTRAILIAAALFVAAVGVIVAGTAGGASQSGASTPTFGNPRKIDNPYLPLSRFARCEVRGADADGTKTRSVQTVLPTPKRFVIGGRPVDALVVRDEAFEDSERVEIALDYFAQSDDGTVYYLGEDVKNIRNGRVVDTKGSWLFGKDTDVPGVIMPAEPKLDARFRSEDVPGITTESDKIEETGLRAKVGARLYTNVIRTSEFTQPEGDVEYKLYAPGVGRIVEYEPEGRAQLVGCR